MKGELIVKYFIEEEEEPSLWFYKEGYHWLCLNEALEEDIDEVEVLGDERGLLSVFYSNWDGMGLWAIMDTSGGVRIKGLTSIERYLVEHGLLIVIINSSYADYNLVHDFQGRSDEEFWMVVDRYGAPKIGSTQRSIKFDDDEDIFEIGWGRDKELIKLSDVIDR